MFSILDTIIDRYREDGANDVVLRNSQVRGLETELSNRGRY